MDRGQPVNEDLVKTAAETFQMPVTVIAALFSEKDPKELDVLMERAFSDCHDDVLLSSLVTLSNSFAHNLERVRRKRGRPPIKLRCMTCAEKR